MDADGKALDLSKRINRYYRIDEKKDTIWGTAKNVLTAAEAARYTVNAVMGGDDHWDPVKIFQPSKQPLGYVVVQGRRLPVNRHGCFTRENL